ncbi:CLUMA_CG006459, isoform A [Clunio marinus]|uniref:CLUMA_CG006459, isoform A n=1 Tax=Clunio marinus TaxID=568069 RepID=A0A1J1HX66_9DIPT|nr:CLUMA_CG006459, isoform A [Clunio marinus]
MEEKMLKQIKLDAEKKKKNGNDVTKEEYCDKDDEKKESSNDDESFKGARRKKKSKIEPADKQWQTPSSHSERSESEDCVKHIPSDPGSPLFKSDHEFSSDVDDTTQTPQPVKRARTTKKLEAVSSSDEDEDINPSQL